eukprot:COSAG01_NODE_1313_length_10770_cov_14.047887_10_plen_101_part_00
MDQYDEYFNTVSLGTAVIGTMYEPVGRIPLYAEPNLIARLLVLRYSTAAATALPYYATVDLASYYWLSSVHSALARPTKHGPFIMDPLDILTKNYYPTNY